METTERTATEQEQRDALASVVDSQRAEIERRWMSAIAVHAARHSLNRSELRNSVPDYLIALVSALHRESSLEEGGAEAWGKIAREHAIARVRQGFNIEELVREFIILRQILFDLAREHAVDGAHLSRLADLLESAIAIAVRSYVESRDYAARRVEAEHIGFVTHELRNPLTTAELMASKLRHKSASSPSPMGSREVDVLDRSLKRIHELIDGVLLVERLNADTVTAQTTALALGDLLSPVIDDATSVAASRGIALEAQFDRDLPVQADPQLTASVLANVLDNAVKYTDEGRVQLVAKTSGDEVVIHVYDNCVGISAEELATIFEPFRRGAHGGKPGTGLGLAIAKRAIEAQGGRIGADSALERGCHFWFTLLNAHH